MTTGSGHGVPPTTCTAARRRCSSSPRPTPSPRPPCSPTGRRGSGPVRGVPRHRPAGHIGRTRPRGPGHRRGRRLGLHRRPPRPCPLVQAGRRRRRPLRRRGGADIRLAPGLTWVELPPGSANDTPGTGRGLRREMAAVTSTELRERDLPALPPIGTGSAETRWPPSAVPAEQPASKLAGAGGPRIAGRERRRSPANCQRVCFHEVLRCQVRGAAGSEARIFEATGPAAGRGRLAWRTSAEGPCRRCSPR